MRTPTTRPARSSSSGRTPTATPSRDQRLPKLQENPGKVWRGLMDIGEDTHDILEELGYSEEEIAKFQAEGVAVKK